MPPCAEGGRLNGKVALITGAAGGIGFATAQRFAAEGATVVLADIDGERLAMQTRQLAAAGLAVAAMPHNVTAESAWDKIVAEILGRYGRLDALVNNAGITRRGSAEEASLEDWRQTLAVNLDGVFLGTRKGIEAMKTSGGAIVNVSSMLGLVGNPSSAAYCASKGGVRNFTKAAALHCADRGYPLRINSVHPGYVETPMLRGAGESHPRETVDVYEARLLSRVPMKRFARPEEIASAILFLASDDASYMTGAELVVDGGVTAH
ncbi:MAG: SDR family oxidoreductase [Desulfobulbus sp.]|nr:SDR family oxidoreductase [Desulfobulbus sp.]